MAYTDIFARFLINLVSEDADHIRRIPADSLNQAWEYIVPGGGNKTFTIEVYETDQDIVNYIPDPEDLVSTDTYDGQNTVEIEFVNTYNSRLVRYIPQIQRNHTVQIRYKKSSDNNNFYEFPTGSIFYGQINAGDSYVFELQTDVESKFVVNACRGWNSIDGFVQFSRLDFGPDPFPLTSAQVGPNNGAGVGLSNLPPNTYTIRVDFVDLEFYQLQDGYFAIYLVPQSEIPPDVCFLSFEWNTVYSYPNPDPDPTPETTYIYTGPPTGAAFRNGTDYLLYLNRSQALPFAPDHPYAQALIDIGYVEPQ